MRNRLVGLARLWCLMLLLCSASAVWPQQPNEGQLELREARVPQDAFTRSAAPAWVIPNEIPATNDKAPVVITLADTQFMVGSIKAVYVRRAIRVNDSGALTEIGRVSISFVPEFQKLQLHTLRILRGGEILDKRDTVNIRFLQRETGLESGVYSGVVMASLLVDDLRVGDTLEYAFTTTGENPVFGNKFADGASWFTNTPTARRVVVLNHPTNRDVRHKFVGDRAPRMEPRREQSGENVRLTWAADDLAAVRFEGFYPRGYNPATYLQFSEYGSWNEVARWALGLFSGDVVIDAALASEIARIKALPDPETRVAAALQFAQNEIRYFSISLGESSHRPSTPQVVMQRRFGDCKDKSWLLITMLRELGVAAHPVLASVDPFSVVREGLPSPAVFDHVIVRVDLDGRHYYLDPARIGQSGRLARMGQIHENLDVLDVTAGTRDLSVVKSANALELAHSDVTETIALPAFGKPGTLTVRSVDHGVGAELLRYLRKTRADELKRGIIDEVVKRYPGATLLGEVDYQDDELENRLTITTRFTVNNIAAEERDIWLVRFVPTNLVRIVAVPPSMQRSAPLGIGAYPYNGKYTLHVQLPPEVSAMLDPASTRVRNKAFDFNITQRFRGSNANAEMRLQTLAPRVSASDLEGYAADVRKMLQAMGGTVVVPKRWVVAKAAAPTASSDSMLGRRLIERAEERIKRYTATISDGKLKGKDLARLHLDRGFSFSELGRTAEALKDMDAALHLDESNPEFLKARAETLFNAGDFQKSVAEYTRALTLGGDPHEVYYRRGMGYFFQNMRNEALSEFEKSMETSEGDNRLFPALWYAWTSLQLNKPLPDAMKKEIDDNSGGAWPRPALALFTGKLSPEAVLKTVEAKTGDERAMALCEAYFYIAQYYLAQKDVAKAKEYLDKARATNIIVYIEYQAARHELSRIAAQR